MTDEKSLLGRSFGMLFVMEMAGVDEDGETEWLCRCDCGDLNIFPQGALLSGNVMDCGCVSRKRRIILRGSDLTGRRFGKVTVIERVQTYNKMFSKWLCRCDCKTLVILEVWCFYDGETSCGRCGAEGGRK